MVRRKKNGRELAGQKTNTGRRSTASGLSTEVGSMLRITANDNPRVLTFRLEGRLEGPWVRELEGCWRRLLDSDSKPTLCVDLTDVTHIDAAGKARLAQMHEHGPASSPATA
jgi:ABC-type transporter Mla MlaB component